MWWTAISVIWRFVSGNWAQAAQLIVDWRKAGLDAAATHEKDELDLASRDLALQARERSVNAQEMTQIASAHGGWLLLAPMAILAWSVAGVYLKMLLIDKVVAKFVFYHAGCVSNTRHLCPDLDALFSTDPLGVDLTSVALGVVSYYFGRALIGAGASIATTVATTLAQRRLP